MQTLETVENKIENNKKFNVNVVYCFKLRLITIAKREFEIKFQYKV